MNNSQEKAMVIDFKSAEKALIDKSRKRMEAEFEALDKAKNWTEENQYRYHYLQQELYPPPPPSPEEISHGKLAVLRYILNGKIRQLTQQREAIESAMELLRPGVGFDLDSNELPF